MRAAARRAAPSRKWPEPQAGSRMESFRISAIGSSGLRASRRRPNASGTRCVRGCRSSRCRSIRRRPACSSSVAMRRSGAPSAARQTGDLQLPGLHLRLRQEPSGPLSGRTEDPPRPHASQAPGDQGGAATAAAPADPRTGEVAAAGRGRLLRLPCGADRRPGPGGRSATTSRIYGGGRFGDEPKGSHDVGTDDDARRRLAPAPAHPPPLAKPAVCPSSTRGRSRMRECRTSGSVRGALSNARPYRD